MDLPKNRFKERLLAGESQIGLWNSIPGSLVAEVLAGAGFDWIAIDTEHAPTDVPDTLSMLQAMAPYPVQALVRPAANDPVLIKRVLDLGAQTLVIPYVQTADEARAAVAAMRYAPRGVRGVAGMTRASRFGAVRDYAVRAEDELCLIVQVETAEAVDRIEEIAGVDGVHGLFVGPADLSASMGLAGQLGHPQVVAKIEEAIRRIVATGKAAGILTVDRDFARQCIALGTTVTAVGVDLHLLLQGARSLAAALRA